MINISMALFGCVLTASLLAVHGSPPLFDTPLQYVAWKLGPSETITLDGKLNDPAWLSVPFTSDFVDIRGAGFPTPRKSTRAKVRWDDSWLYVGALLHETEIWANQTQRNSVVFLDNDFEVFVCPDGSNHFYKEFEMNAANTIWSLVLNQPYLNGGSPVNTLWPIRSAVFVDGVLNVPSPATRFWSVEIAFPFQQYVINTTASAPPKPNDVWRINFSRVEWTVRVVNGRYEKVPNKNEDNWVWSPQHAINMHLPERYGFVTLAAGSRSQTVPDPVKATHWNVRYALAEAYYALTAFASVNGYYTTNVSELFQVPSVLLDGTLGTTPPVIRMPAYGRWGFTDITVYDAQNSSVWGTIDQTRKLQLHTV
jgi:hypothetical protein